MLHVYIALAAATGDQRAPQPPIDLPQAVKGALPAIGLPQAAKDALPAMCAGVEAGGCDELVIRGSTEVQALWPACLGRFVRHWTGNWVKEGGPSNLRVRNWQGHWLVAWSNGDHLEPCLQSHDQGVASPDEVDEWLVYDEAAKHWSRLPVSSNCANEPEAPTEPCCERVRLRRSGGFDGVFESSGLHYLGRPIYWQARRRLVLMYGSHSRWMMLPSRDELVPVGGLWRLETSAASSGARCPTRAQAHWIEYLRDEAGEPYPSNGFSSAIFSCAPGRAAAPAQPADLPTAADGRGDSFAGAMCEAILEEGGRTVSSSEREFCGALFEGGRGEALVKLVGEGQGEALLRSLEALSPLASKLVGGGGAEGEGFEGVAEALYETPLASGLRQYIAETYGSVDSYLETHGAGVLQYLTETYV